MSITRKLSDDEKRLKRNAYDREWRKNNQEKRLSHRRKNKYGITSEQWDALFASQGSSCAICHTTDIPKSGWHTDHCHSTGKVRGILCHSCNVGLGHFKDNPSTLAAGIAYLKAHNGTN